MKEAESIDKFILVKTAKFDEFVQTQKTLAQSPIREVLTAAATISHEFGRVDTTEESKTLLFKDTLYDLTRHLAEYLRAAGAPSFNLSAETVASMVGPAISKGEASKAESAAASLPVVEALPVDDDLPPLTATQPPSQEQPEEALIIPPSENKGQEEPATQSEEVAKKMELEIEPQFAADGSSKIQKFWKSFSPNITPSWPRRSTRKRINTQKLNL